MIMKGAGKLAEVETSAGQAGPAAVTITHCPGIEKRLIKAITQDAVSTGPKFEPQGWGVCRIAPGEVLLVQDDAATVENIAPGYDSDSERLTVDATSAYQMVRVEGAMAGALLAKAATIDLDPAAFPTGAFAVCRFGIYRVGLRHLEEAVYDCLVDRSLVGDLVSYLMDLGREFEAREAINR